MSNSCAIQYDDSIEVIIANDDNMAVGAVKAIQKYGYNKAQIIFQEKLTDVILFDFYARGD